MKPLVALLLALAAAPGWAVDRGSLPGGGAYVSGGIGQEEIAELSQERPRYTAWLVTAARGSGAWLSDAWVRVTDTQGRALFDRSLDGPWLLLDLPPGSYRVEVRCEGFAEQRTLTLRRGAGTRQLIFYFGVVADVLPRDGRGG